MGVFIQFNILEQCILDCRRVRLGLGTSVQLFLLLVWYRILPVCFRKKFCRSERALLSAHLSAISLSVLPMAIGLNPPTNFLRAIRFTPKKKGLRGSDILPSPMRFIRLVGGFRKLSPAMPFNLLTRSLKI